MILLAILLQSAPQTAIEAERAFAADAQSIGQWTAFRKWATADATMFLPQPGNAQAFLAPLQDPPRAVEWWPTTGFVSCDGKLAVNTGGATWPGGRAGYFTTIWARQADGGWRWTLDHGGDEPVARPRPAADGPPVRRASCENKPRALIQARTRGTKQAAGTSPDRTLGWNWTVAADGGRYVNVHLWTGDRYELVIADRVAAPVPATK